MNRKSLFGRLADSTKAFRTAERQEYFRVNLEPLEDRKMLATTVYVNDNWIRANNAATLVIGEFVTSTEGPSGSYGIDVFGTTSTGSLAGAALIADAIDNVDEPGTVVILDGTYAESDIVIDKQITLTGNSQVTPPTIVPETASSDSSGAFASGTHSGLIVYSANVTIRDLIIQGTGNGFTRDYHHGITTIHDTPAGGTVRDGTLTLKTLGPQGQPGANSSVPNLLIQRVDVRNTYWTGITVSALANRSFDTGAGEASNLTIRDSKVDNVGDTKDTNRVGILVQNFTDQTSGGVNLLITQTPNVFRNTISNVGVGVRTTSFGSNFNWPDGDGAPQENGATNRTSVAAITVNQAEVFAFDMINAGEEFAVGLTANYTGSNNATGVNINNSEQVYTGLNISGYKIGFHAQAARPNDNTVRERYPQFALGANIIGPGSTVSGSIGALFDNDGTTDESSSGLFGQANITGFETGIKALQTVSASDGKKNRILVLQTFLTNNGTDVSIGQDSTLEGYFHFGNAKVVLSGNGVIDPRVYNYDRDGEKLYTLNPTDQTPVFAPDNADEMLGSAVTLSSGGAYNVTITGQSASSVFEDFNAAQSYPGQLSPPISPLFNTTTNTLTLIPGTMSNFASLNDWSGDITQDGVTGSVVVGGNATTGNGLDMFYGLNKGTTSGTFFNLDGVDLSGATYFDIDLKIGSGNLAGATSFGLFDDNANLMIWPFTLSAGALNSTAFTKLSINLVTPSVPIFGDRLDLTNIAGFGLFGENGFLDAGASLTTPQRLSLNSIETHSLPNSKLTVSSSINLAGASLTGTVRSGFTATSGQQFTIVNNTSGSAVTGTFSGQAQGSTVTISGQKFTINYSGGTGNDVVLTKIPDAPINSATVSGRHLFYNNSIWDNPTFGFNNSSAIATDKSAYLPSGFPTGTVTVGVANVTSYSRGINGIMVDLTGTSSGVSTNDFVVKMSGQDLAADNTPSGWAAAPAFTVTAVPNTPAVGTTRYELIWPDNSIVDRYISVTTLATADTGLATADTFYFGNRVGDAFTTYPGFFNTDATDALEARGNQSPFVSITNPYDFDRDAVVNATDELIARFDQNFMAALVLSNPPAAPEGADGSGSAVASALAGAGGGDGDGGSSGSSLLGGGSASSGPSASAVAQLMESSSPAGGDDGGDDAGDDAGDDDLLDSLLDDLS
jgi:hypothetical protein